MHASLAEWPLAVLLAGLVGGILVAFRLGVTTEHWRPHTGTVAQRRRAVDAEQLNANLRDRNAQLEALVRNVTAARVGNVRTLRPNRHGGYTEPADVVSAAVLSFPTSSTGHRGAHQ